MKTEHIALVGLAALAAFYIGKQTVSVPVQNVPPQNSLSQWWANLWG